MSREKNNVIMQIIMAMILLQSYIFVDKKQNFILANLTFANATELKYNVPKGVLLGIAAHESGWGTSKAYKDYCNPFGLRTNKDKPIRFKSYAHCYEYIGKLFSQSERYNKTLCKNEYRLYLITLVECGYNTQDPLWAGKIIRIINQENLSK